MPRAENKNRYLLAAAVAGLHIGLVAIFIETQSLAVHSHAGPAAVMTVSLRMPTRRPRPFPAPAPPRRAPITAPISEPVHVPGPSALRIEVPRAIDWLASARQAAAAVLARKPKTAFGFSKRAAPFQALTGSSADSPPHAGESYRTHTGREVRWVSKHCYLVSAAAQPGEPQTEREARLSRISCNGSGSSSAGNLFKSLPAYRHNHRTLDRRHEAVARRRHGPRGKFEP